MRGSRLIASRLAAQGHVRQIEAALATDRIGERIGHSLRAGWVRLLAEMRNLRSAWEVQAAAAKIFAGLRQQIYVEIDRQLVALAVWSHRSAVANLMRTLPATYLTRVTDAKRLRAGRQLGFAEAARRIGQPGASSPVSRQADEDFRPVRDRGQLFHAISGRRSRVQRELIEDAPYDSPGLLALAANADRLAATDILEPLREPAEQVDDVQELIQRLLFPSPPAEQIHRYLQRLIIAGETWEQRLQRATLAYDPMQLASQVAAAYSRGLNQREIAREIEPLFNLTHSAAKRLGRTYGMAIAHDQQLAVTNELGDLVIGYQVHATLDQHTRPEHRARNGRIYYRNPRPGERDLSELPRPPLEADGSVAWNCRCFLTPLLAPPVKQSPETRKVFTQAAGKVIPNPVDYSAWFASVNECRWRMAVGTRRYSAMREVLGREPSYADFVRPESGKLLSVREIEREAPEARAKRLEAVQKEMAAQATAIRQTATFGYLPPEPARS